MPLHKIIRTACFLTLALWSAGAGLAQQGAGTIFGTITDPSDASVPSAEVEIRNLATNAVFRTRTNADGFFTAPAMPVGRYEIRVQTDGFKQALSNSIILQVDQKAQVNMRLEIGTITEVVEVVADTPLVQTGSPTIGTVVEARRITDLPLNGRNALALTLLTAGVKSNAGPTNTGFADRGIQISSISINGGPNSMNAQLLDGNTNILSYVGEVGIPPGVDAVEEFKVQTGPMSAEFGFTAGGAINLVTKSGTNSVHGVLYEFLRNDKLDARNSFSPTKAPLRYNQFGGSIGGPIVRDKTFGFFNLEEYRLRRSYPVIGSTPIAEQRQGDFSRLLSAQGTLIPVHDPATTRQNPEGKGFIRDAFPNNVIPTDRLDPVAENVLPYYPLPNRQASNPFTNSNNYQRVGKDDIDSRQFTTKVDHHFSERNSLFARYSQFRHSPFGTEFFPDPVAISRNDITQNKNFVVSDTHVFSPTLLNEVRLGFSRQLFTFESASYGQNFPQQLGLPANVPSDVFPEMRIDGFPTIGNGVVGARGALTWDFQELLTKIHGNHTLKFGWSHQLLQGSNVQSARPSGRFTFNSRLTANPQTKGGAGAGLSSFVLGSVANSIVDTNLGSTNEAYATSLFVQDDWKVSRRLTLNLGLRWDLQKKPVERHNGIINFDPQGIDSVSGLLGQTVYAGVNGQPLSFRDDDYTDFGPRAGFAWDVFGTGKTVLRGGYGIFYPSIFWRDYFGNTQLFARTSTSYSPPGNNVEFPAFQLQQGFPFAPLQSQGAALGSGALLGQPVELDETFGATPLSQQWNLSLQQQIGEWLVDMTYTANLGSHFSASMYDFNQLDPQYMDLGFGLFEPVPNPNQGLIPGPLGDPFIVRYQSLLPFPQYGEVWVSSPSLGSYNSHLFLLKVERRMTSGLLVSFSFTGGKVISDSLSTPVNFGLVEQTNEIFFQNGKYDRRQSRSLDPTDVSARGVLSLVYELPFGRGNGLRGKFLGGWQVSTIGTMQTGLPTIVRQSGALFAIRPNSTGNSARLDNPTREQWFDTTQFVGPGDFAFGNLGRVLPDVRTPGTHSWDFAVLKNTHLTERFTLQFRAEAFNAFNNVNLLAPNSVFAAGADGLNQSGGFGVITGARDARIMQFGLKLIF